MAVKDWHPGQLVAFWLGVAVAAFLTMIVLGNIAKAVAGNMMAGVVGMLAFVSCIAFGVGTTWKWFGARKKSPGADT